jgi:hypothetical protein
MTAQMIDDDTVYREICGRLSDTELEQVSTVLQAWAQTTDRLPSELNNLKIVLAACVETIGTMGPAYCRIAAVTLLARAAKLEM